MNLRSLVHFAVVFPRVKYRLIDPTRRINVMPQNRNAIHNGIGIQRVKSSFKIRFLRCGCTGRSNWILHQN